MIRHGLVFSAETSCVASNNDFDGHESKLEEKGARRLVAYFARGPRI